MSITESFKQLKQAWLQEQFSPDILEYKKEIVEHHLGQISSMEDQLDVEFKTTEQKFLANIYEMELERIKYVLRCYLKIRIKKIEKYCMFIINNGLEYKLSDKEQEYVRGYCDLIGDHLDKTFLCQLPEQFKSLTNKNMIPEPSLDRHVFIKVKQDVGDFQLDNSGVETVKLDKDDTYVVRYKPVQHLLATGQVELI